MNIYIPSRSRPHLVATGPAAQLPPDLIPTFVVPYAQTEDYKAAVSRASLKAHVLGIHYSGIAEKRHKIGRIAAERGERKFVMLDDDIGFLVRRDADTWRLRGTEPSEVGDMFHWIDAQLDTYQQVGISAREGNNRPGVGPVETLVDVNTRCMRVLAYQTDVFNAMKHGRVDFMEDFDIALQILESGGSNILSYWWAQGQAKTNDSGGCSDYRTHELHERSAIAMSELHPGFVGLRQKKNKTDADGFGTRTECTIYWKKAAKYGESKRTNT